MISGSNTITKTSSGDIAVTKMLRPEEFHFAPESLVLKLIKLDLITEIVRNLIQSSDIEKLLHIKVTERESGERVILVQTRFSEHEKAIQDLKDIIERAKYNSKVQDSEMYKHKKLRESFEEELILLTEFIAENNYTKEFYEYKTDKALGRKQWSY